MLRNVTGTVLAAAFEQKAVLIALEITTNLTEPDAMKLVPGMGVHAASVALAASRPILKMAVEILNVTMRFAITIWEHVPVRKTETKL